MALGALETLLYTLTDGDAWHDNDELSQPVAAVELVDGADVTVGLAGAGLHLHGEVTQATVGGHARWGKRVALLDGVKITLQLEARKAQAVGVAHLDNLALMEADAISATKSESMNS